MIHNANEVDTLYMTGVSATLQELCYTSQPDVVVEPQVLRSIREALIPAKFGVVPALVSRIVRTPRAKAQAFDLYVCFDPKNAADPAAIYHLVQPLRMNLTVKVGGYDFSPMLPSLDFARQFSKNRQTA